MDDEDASGSDFHADDGSLTEEETTSSSKSASDDEGSDAARVSQGKGKSNKKRKGSKARSNAAPKHKKMRFTQAAYARFVHCLHRTIDTFIGSEGPIDRAAKCSLACHHGYMYLLATHVPFLWSRLMYNFMLQLLLVRAPTIPTISCCRVCARNCTSSWRIFSRLSYG